MNKIEQAAPGEHEEILRVLNEAVIQGEGTRGPGLLTLDKVDALLANVDGRSAAYVIKDSSDQIIAFSWLVPHTGRTVYNVCCEIEIYVSNDHRGRGAARLLLDHTVAKAKELKIITLLAYINEAQSHALAWAFRAGFYCAGGLPKVALFNGSWVGTSIFQMHIEGDVL